MKKFILILTMALLITTAAADIEQHQGFPVRVGDELKAPLVAKDINGDGKLEIIAALENRMVKVFNHTGALLWQNTGGVADYDTARVPLVTNLSGDNKLEILTYGNPGMSDATFYLWDVSGIKLMQFLVGKYLIVSPPSITKDGIILTGVAPGVSFSAITQATGVYAFDTQGNKLWYLELGRSVNPSASLPVGDIDGDGIDEAVILTQDINSGTPADGKIWLVKAGRTGGIIWDRDLGGDARSAAIADLNNDSKNEIAVVSSSGLYIFDVNGTLLNNFKININRAPPAIGDIDEDGVNDTTVASSADNKIYIISRGSLKEFYAERVSGNLALGDINGDGKLEIAAGDLYGNMVVWDYNGNIIDKIKLTGKYQYFTSAMIADLEGDGNKEIILGNKNGNIYVYTYMSKPKDTTPPTTTDDVDGQWHNSSVTVTLTAKDDESGVATTYYTIDDSEPTSDSARGTSITLSEDGIYTIKYFSVDHAGNVEPVKTAANKVMIDRTFPSTTNDADGQWHNSSVVVILAPEDAGSGIRDTYYAIDGEPMLSGTTITVSGDGIHTIKYFSVDNAGNGEPVKETQVKIDSMPPITSDDSDNGWHNIEATLNLTASDDLSGMAFMYYAADGHEQVSYSSNVQVTFRDEGVHHIKYYSVDNAGNVEELKNAQVKIDKTRPATVDDSDGRWHNSGVTVQLVASDNLAGVYSTHYKVNSATKTVMESFVAWLSSAVGLAETATLQGDTVSLSDDGVFNIQYYSMDNAGNTEEEKISKQVKIDRTSPEITGATTTLPNVQGWNNGDVTVHFECRDWLSGVESCTPDILVSNEGAWQNVKGIALDKAGNSAGIAVSGINIDKTQPVITADVPQNKTYLHSDVITLSFSSQDALSGIMNMNSAIDGTRHVGDGQLFDMLELSFGAHEFYITAEDNAGNLNSRKVLFNVIATIDSLAALTERGSSSSGTITSLVGSNVWITNNGVANSLKAKLNSARQKMDAGQKSAAKNILEAYINEVEAQNGKGITAEGAGILRAEARYVIDHMQ